MSLTPIINAAEPKPDLALAAWDANRREQWHLRVEVDGKSVSTLCDEAFAAVFKYADWDGNGSLDKAEVGRVPTAFTLRAVLWGQFSAGMIDGPPLSELDADQDGKVSSAELTDHYRRAGLGGVLVGVGKPPATAALTDALLKLLASDGDKQVSEKKWRSAAETLAKLDTNDDELVSPGELVPRTTYPGATGGMLLKAPAVGDTPNVTVDGLPLIVLPARSEDRHWATALSVHRGGKPSVAELLAWRDQAPAARWTIRFGRGATTGRVEHHAGQTRFALRPDDGKLPGQFAAARKRIQAQFTTADAKGSGFIEAAAAKGPDQAELKRLIAAADRDADGKLTSAELTAWLDLQERFVRAHVLLTLLDHGAGLFELLDADHDGALSVREFRGAWSRLTAAGVIADGRLDRTKLPRTLVATVSRGLPTVAIARAPAGGPDWFRAMDRNGDGDVSAREFTGTADQFRSLDTDRDSLLSAAEAEAGVKK